MTNSDKSFNITVKYPFDYNNNTVVYTDEDGPPENFNFDLAIHICAQLFVGVVIVTGIAAVATLLMSCAVHKNEHAANKVSIAVSDQFYHFYFKKTPSFKWCQHGKFWDVQSPKAQDYRSNRLGLSLGWDQCVVFVGKTQTFTGINYCDLKK